MSGLSRHLVYSSDKARTFMCVAAARDPAHALKIARKHGLTLHKGAWARAEDMVDRLKLQGVA